MGGQKTDEIRPFRLYLAARLGRQGTHPKRASLAEDVDLLDLEDYMMDFLSEEFSCDAEDGSVRQV